MNTAVTCPKCESPSVEIIPFLKDGTLLEACRTCGAFWEAELREVPAVTPCDNCAWRPGSPERSDPERWAYLMAEFKRGASFYCHKRVPAILDDHGYSFQFAIEQKDGRQVCTNAPICAGWVAWKLGQIYKPKRELPAEAEAAR